MWILFLTIYEWLQSNMDSLCRIRTHNLWCRQHCFAWKSAWYEGSTVSVLRFILNVKGKPNACHFHVLRNRYTREVSQPLRQLGRRQHHHTVAKRRRRHAVCGGAERSSLIGCQPGGRHCDEEQGAGLTFYCWHLHPCYQDVINVVLWALWDFMKLYRPHKL